MNNNQDVVSVIIAGLGGQGVITVSDILAEAIFQSGYDIKKSEIHGMSQRGGSVTSDIRFGQRVCSPAVPVGEADYLLVISADQLDKNRHLIKPDGVILTPDMIDHSRLPNARSINLAVLGLLAGHLPTIKEAQWQQAIRKVMPDKLHETALLSFDLGRKTNDACS